MGKHLLGTEAKTQGSLPPRRGPSSVSDRVRLHVIYSSLVPVIQALLST